jgi:eukaryotic-like serine/threonine-protein kinase
MPPLARPWRDVSVTRAPSSSRVDITRDGDMLILDVPPAGFTGGVAANLGFSVVWNVFVGVWTAGALASAGILFALFSVPFWCASPSPLVVTA